MTRIDLMGWAHFKLFGGKGRHEITVSEFFRIVDSKKARDIARGDSWMLSVKENDTLQATLDKSSTMRKTCSLSRTVTTKLLVT